MGYKVASYDLVTAWMDLLDGTISVPVYREVVPESETGDYVFIREDGESQEKNKGGFFTNCGVIVEIVTHFSTYSGINGSAANTIDNKITDILFPLPNTHGLVMEDHHIASIRRESLPAVIEDSEPKVYRKIARYEHLIIQ